MNIYLKHFNIVVKHKYYVMRECFRRKLYWQGIVHDLSKFSFAEFTESAKHFQGTGSPIIASRKVNGYSIAWLHHKSHNKHHWDYWVDFDHGKLIPVPIPKKYIIEMACDMIGASKAYGGASSPLDYFKGHSPCWLMRPEDKAYLEELLIDAGE